MNKYTERLYNGLVKENPTFVLMLGMCPTLAVTTSAINGIGMGLSTTVVLVLSNMLIFHASEDHSGFRAYAGIYRCCGILCNDRSVFDGGVCAEPLCVARNLYPADRCKLYHFGKSGKLRVQESGAAVHV